MGSQYHAPATVPWGMRPSTHSTGCWVGLRTVVDRSRKSRPHWDSNPSPSSPQQVTILTAISWMFSALIIILKNIKMLFLPFSHWSFHSKRNGIPVYWSPKFNSLTTYGDKKNQTDDLLWMPEANRTWHTNHSAIQIPQKSINMVPVFNCFTLLKCK